MKKQRTRRLGIVAVATAALLAVTGCTPQASNSDKSITVFAVQEPGTKLDSNAYTKHLEEKFKVDLKFVTTTGWDGASANEKRQISLASGDYPDAYMLVSWVTGFSQAEQLKLSKQGVLLPFNDLIDKHAPHIKAALKDNPELRALATAPDGKIWGMPQWNDCFHCSYANKLWMNSDWLKKLGLKQPTTPDELFTVLTAFKTQDPNGNGVADEIPLSSAGDGLLAYLMDPFIYMSAGSDSSPRSLGLDGKKVKLQATQEGYREGLKYVRKLWAAGLIDPSAFSQNGEALTAKGDNPGAAVLGAVTTVHPYTFQTAGNPDGRDKAYDAVPPLTGPNGNAATYALPTSPAATFVITSKATKEEQVKLIEILDYMYTDEGQILGQFGEEGTDWAKPAAGAVALDEKLPPMYELLPPTDANKTPNHKWGPTAQYFNTRTFRNSQVVPTDIYDPSGLERRLYEATLLYEGKETSAMFPYWSVWVPEKSASELATAQTNVESAIKQAAAEFVTGTRDINDDAAWKTYVTSLDALGAKQYVDIYQTAYDASKK